MALIKCRHCGKEISDKAERCIHCGYLIKKTHEQDDVNPFETIRNRFVGAIILLIIIYLLYMWMYGF